MTAEAGFAALDKGEFEQAIELLTAALKDGSPDRARIHLGLGFAHGRLDDRDAARSQLEKALNANPSGPTELLVLNQLAALDLEADHVNAAVAKYRTVVQGFLKADQRTPALLARHNLGNALLQARLAAEARDVYSDVKRELTSTLGHEHRATLASTHNLAIAESRMGESDTAIAQLETVAQLMEHEFGAIDRDTLSARQSLTTLLLLRGDRDARERLQRLHADMKLALDHTDERMSVVRMAWRALTTGEVDLSGMALPHAQLATTQLQGARLLHADLTGADLRDSDCTGADFTGACLHRADLRGAVLRDAKLPRADLRETLLDRASLAGAGLVAAQLSRASLVGCDLSGADLSAAALDDTDLTRVASSAETVWPGPKPPPWIGSVRSERSGFRPRAVLSEPDDAAEALAGRHNWWRGLPREPDVPRSEAAWKPPKRRLSEMAMDLPEIAERDEFLRDLTGRLERQELATLAELHALVAAHFPSRRRADPAFVALLADAGGPVRVKRTQPYGPVGARRLDRIPGLLSKGDRTVFMDAAHAAWLAQALSRLAPVPYREPDLLAWIGGGEERARKLFTAAQTLLRG